MFVCLCHAVTDQEINAAIAAGVDSVGGLMSELEVATQCGGCLGEIVNLLADSEQSKHYVVNQDNSQISLEKGVGFYSPEYC